MSNKAKEPEGYVAHSKYPDRQKSVTFSTVADIKQATEAFRTIYRAFPEGYRRPDTICLNRAAIDQLNDRLKAYRPDTIRFARDDSREEPEDEQRNRKAR